MKNQKRGADRAVSCENDHKTRKTETAKEEETGVGPAGEGATQIRQARELGGALLARTLSGEVGSQTSLCDLGQIYLPL